MSEQHDHYTGEVITHGNGSNHPPQMPAEIAKAIIAIKKQVKSLRKDEENKFARFQYASVDAFYEAIGPLMAEAGLFVMTEEASTQTDRRETSDDTGRTKTANWLLTNYELTLYHESGIGWGPIHRSIMVAATGPQAYGAGQSYVEKYFLRGLFKVPTGDTDADSHIQAGLPVPRQRPRQPIPRPPQQTPPPLVKPNGEDRLEPENEPDEIRARDVYMRLINEINLEKQLSKVDEWLFIRDHDGNLTDEQTEDFALVDRYNQESAKHLIKCAKARKQELRALESNI